MILRKIASKLKCFRIKQTFTGLPRGNADVSQRLILAVEWLEFAHEQTGFKGVSAGYSLMSGKWEKAYRETTGYIIPSFLVYGRKFEKQEFIDQAIQMGEWELRVQNKDGSFGEEKGNGSVSKKVFNTGQVIIGLVALYQFTKNKDFLNAAQKAADWIVSVQKPEGFWVETDDREPKTYQARVSWALLLVWQETGQKKYYQSSLENIEWVLSRQKENGWFENTSLHSKDSTWVHLIGYTVSGLWESGQLVNDLGLKKRIFLSVELFFKNLFQKINKTGFLAGEFDENWRGDNSYSCLVGNIQLAIICLKFHYKIKNLDYLQKSKKLIDYVAGKQVTAGSKEFLGSIPGSWPVNGKYAPYFLPNWAAKFFVDALLLELDPELEFFS